jgi:hypothetical protein
MPKLIPQPGVANLEGTRTGGEVEPYDGPPPRNPDEYPGMPLAAPGLKQFITSGER